MTITFIATAAGGDLTANTIAANKPTNTADGDIMFAVTMGFDRYVSTPPTGWTRAAQMTSTRFWELWYRVASSESATSYTWDYGASQSRLAVRIVTYRGNFNPYNPIDVISNTQYVVSNTTYRAAAMTVSAANSALIFFANGAANSSNTYTKPANIGSDAWAEDVDSANTGPGVGNSNTEVCSMIWTGSGSTGNMDATGTSATIKHAFAVALRATSVKNLNGLVLADAKTKNGLAGASIKNFQGLS